MNEDQALVVDVLMHGELSQQLTELNFPFLQDLRYTATFTPQIGELKAVHAAI